MKNSLKPIIASLVLLLAVPSGNCAAVDAPVAGQRGVFLRRIEALEKEPVTDLRKRVAQVDQLLTDAELLTGRDRGVVWGETMRKLVPENSSLYNSSLRWSLNHVNPGLVNPGSIIGLEEDTIVAPSHLPGLEQAEQEMTANLEKLRKIIARNKAAGAAPLPDASSSAAAVFSASASAP